MRPLRGNRAVGLLKNRPDIDYGIVISPGGWRIAAKVSNAALPCLESRASVYRALRRFSLLLPGILRT